MGLGAAGCGWEYHPGAPNNCAMDASVAPTGTVARPLPVVEGRMCAHLRADDEFFCLKYQEPLDTINGHPARCDRCRR